ncbi:chemotaxis protein CheW [Sorangium sp. So ce131]|uniref:chemotaxis protein CheW n=1 Tax=Sorangium sp. So ce131 TaxID=3133282 RepID=UPI003F634B4A
MERARLARRLAELQQAFDASFARSAEACPEEAARALAIRAGGRRLVVRIEELAAVEPYRRTAPLAGGPPGLLGLAGLRGRLVAVYDLAALLGGRPRGGADVAGGAGGGGEGSRPAPRWLLVCARSPDLALAVDEIERHVGFSSADVRPLSGGDPGGHVGEAVEIDGAPLGILRVPSVVAAVLARAQGGAERSKGDR